MVGLREVRVGTRGSRLALIQTEYVIKRLQELNDCNFKFTVVKIKTTGDKIEESTIKEIGKGIFEREIDEALLKGEIDLAVHSMKDVPTSLPVGVSIVAVPERLSPCDAFVSNRYPSLSSMPKGATIGTSSLRRAAQIKCLRRDLNIVPLRGNVDTRIRCLMEEKYDGIVIAEAALIRLGFGGKWEQMTIELFPTSPGQGALAVTARSQDFDIRSLASRINSPDDMEEVLAEREFLKIIGSGCSAPVGFTARADGNFLRAICGLYALDGSKSKVFTFSFPRGDPEGAGRKAAEVVMNDNEIRWFWREYGEG
ncbi:MAG: hydroxymethylbilane synthase [Candidatus Methanomethylicaceae archaeon]